MQWALIVSGSQSVVTELVITMARVGENQQRLIEKDLFGFCLSDGMFFGALPSVTVVPLKANKGRPVDHGCILSSYTDTQQRAHKSLQWTCGKVTHFAKSKMRAIAARHCTLR
jgi:hypothetical protein